MGAGSMSGKPRYPYWIVESALAQTFGIEPQQQKGAFRARITHLRRLGLGPEGPGKGQAIAYSREDIDRWLIALELEHFGIDPTQVVDLFARLGIVIKHYSKEARASKQPNDDIIMFVEFGPFGSPPQIGISKVGDRQRMDKWLLRSERDGVALRVAFFGISARLRSIDKLMDHYDEFAIRNAAKSPKRG
jgi:hypothetical protein